MPVSSSALDVYLGGQPVAELRPAASGAGQYELIYSPDVVARFQGRYLLSISLPVRAPPYDVKQTEVFFEGLLPEGRLRDRLCRRLHLDVDDTFGLLREIGRDCAGAISIIPAGEPTPPSQGDIHWLTEAEVEEIVADLPLRPLGDNPEEGIRMSLAGAQDKIPVVIDGDRIGLPVGVTPSTHILKPASTETNRRGRLLYPDVVQNEAICLDLARRCGLDTVAADIRVYGVGTLVVERYDRRRVAGAVDRIHQEDICQALGVPAAQKYEEDGGPGVAEVVSLLRDVSTRAAVDTLSFLRRVAFNYLLGNLDAHAKNTSLLYAIEGLRLAPLYDVVSTVVYPQLSNRLAMAIGGQFQSDQVTSRHWSQLLDECDMNTAAGRRMLAQLAQSVLDLLSVTRAEATERGLDTPVFDTIAAYASARAPALLDLPGYAGRRTRR